MNIPIDDYGYDEKFTRRFFLIFGNLIAFVFRLKIDRSQVQADFSRSGIIVVNHGNGFWGIVDVIISCHVWYNVLQREHAISLMSDERVFQVKGVGWFCKKIGIKASSIKSLENCIKNRRWAIVAPGGNTDQLKSFWYRQNIRLYKSVSSQGDVKKKPQTWFVHVARKHHVPIYPTAISGTNDITPILWESRTIYRYTGLEKIRGGEFWPGFPFSLNHIINMCLFVAFGFSDSVIAWLVFIAANLYIDAVYSYPVFFPTVRLKFFGPIETQYPNLTMSVKDKKEEDLLFLEKIGNIINGALIELDRKRFWGRALPVLTESSIGSN